VYGYSVHKTHSHTHTHTHTQGCSFRLFAVNIPVSGQMCNCTTVPNGQKTWRAKNKIVK